MDEIEVLVGGHARGLEVDGVEGAEENIVHKGHVRGGGSEGAGFLEVPLASFDGIGGIDGIVIEDWDSGHTSSPLNLGVAINGKGPSAHCFGLVSFSPGVGAG